MHTPLDDQSPERSQHPSRRRRGTALGLAAGLLGGGAVGLILTVPGLTSAATDSTSTTEPVTTVVATDTVDATDTATDTAVPDRGARLRDALQSLVDDGTITAAQADAVAEHLAASMPRGGGGGHGRHGGFGDGGQVVAEALGIDVDTLRTELRSGKTIAAIAGEQGVDVQLVIDALVAEATEHIDQAVTDGRLTQEEADARLAELTERITDRVNNGGPRGGGRHGHMADAAAAGEA
jgi:polyhydroxyalkanoate synthesis regulator phasin